jgi:hypothetical protein
MRSSLAVLWLTITGLGVGGSTLEKLTVNDMIDKSTAVVHGRIVGTPSSSYSGTTIYTHYSVQVIDRWKGALGSLLDVVVPGGVVGKERQVFAGAPKPAQGGEYVLFLWTSRTGLTHIIGLSQGLMSVKVDSTGTAVVTRAASTEEMVDASGHATNDTQLTFSLQDLATRIGSRLQGK